MFTSDLTCKYTNCCGVAGSIDGTFNPALCFRKQRNEQLASTVEVCSENAGP